MDATLHRGWGKRDSCRQGVQRRRARVACDPARMQPTVARDEPDRLFSFSPRVHARVLFAWVTTAVLGRLCSHRPRVNRAPRVVSSVGLARPARRVVQGPVISGESSAARSFSARTSAQRYGPLLLLHQLQTRGRPRPRYNYWLQSPSAMVAAVQEGIVATARGEEHSSQYSTLSNTKVKWISHSCSHKYHPVLQIHPSMWRGSGKHAGEGGGAAGGRRQAGRKEVSHSLR